MATRPSKQRSDGQASRESAAQTKTIITGVVIGAMLLIGFFLIASIGGALPSTQSDTVVNESVTVDFNNLSKVEKFGDRDAETFEENEKVYNSSNVQLTEGTDYQWYTNGTIEWFDTSKTSDGESATVTYTYKTKQDEFYTTIDRIAQGMLIGGVVIVVLYSAVILRVLRGL